MSAIADYAAKSDAVARDAAGKLRALSPPAEKASDYAAYLTTLDQEVAAIGQLSAVARSANPGLVQAVAGQVDKIERRAATQAQALGLDKCARAADTGAS